MRVLLSTTGSRGDVEPMVGLAVRLRALRAEVRVCAPPSAADLPRRAECGSIEHARQDIAAYIDKYHRRPHSEIGSRTPLEVAATWRQHPEHKAKLRPEVTYLTSGLMR